MYCNISTNCWNESRKYSCFDAVILYFVYNRCFRYFDCHVNRPHWWRRFETRVSFSVRDNEKCNNIYCNDQIWNRFICSLLYNRRLWLCTSKYFVEFLYFSYVTLFLKFGGFAANTLDNLVFSYELYLHIIPYKLKTYFEYTLIITTITRVMKCK